MRALRMSAWSTDCNSLLRVDVQQMGTYNSCQLSFLNSLVMYTVLVAVVIGVFVEVLYERATT
jgi:hypothetical protein